MIPKSIRIEGFLSYQTQVNIDFSDIKLACISGANGAGKSSILDSITWALFGYARSRSDSIINQNCQAAEVRFDFVYENQSYRIQRAKPKDKPQVLEFNIFDETQNKWRPLTEHNLTETQKRIESILRMDYDTFTNAAFFLQGKADQFTQLSPGRRKEILSNILGLEIWEAYRVNTREKRREQEIQHQNNQSLMEEITKEVEEEPLIQQRILDFQAELTDKEKINETLSTLFDQTKHLEQNKRLSRERLNELRDNIITRQNQLTQQKSKLETLNHEQSDYDALLAEEDNIRILYNRWLKLKKQLEEEQNKANHFFSLNQKLNKHQQIIEREKANLQAEYNTLIGELEQIEKISDQIPKLTDEIQSLLEKNAELTLELNKTGQIQQDLENTQAKLTTKQSELAQINTTYQELRSKYKDFHNAGPTCPFCSQPLTPEHREKYETHITSEGTKLKDQKETLEKEINSLNNDVSAYRTMIQTIIKQQQDFHKINNQISILETEKKQKESQLDQWKKDKANRFAQLKDMLAQENYAQEDRTAAHSLIEQIKELNYDSEKHQANREQVDQLQDIESKFHALEIAAAALAPIKKQAQELKETIKDLEENLQHESDRLTDLEKEYEQNYNNQPDLNTLQQDLDKNQIEINRLNQFIGAEKQKQNYLVQKKEDKQDLQLRNDELTILINRYKKLEEAFSKNGIPALLIEQALPEIENHANEYLEKLTNGTMTLKFETQGEYKDKKRKDKKETLEILINDPSGNYRAYEMFSGGEAFRINFSIRLALSQVLSKRAGARLQTLVIDEGFGSQDLEGRQRLVEAINLVQKDFERIFVITHLEELKDVFPTRIEVFKTNNGSQIEVIAL